MNMFSLFYMYVNSYRFVDYTINYTLNFPFVISQPENDHRRQMSLSSSQRTTPAITPSSSQNSLPSGGRHHHKLYHMSSVPHMNGHSDVAHGKTYYIYAHTLNYWFQ